MNEFPKKVKPTIEELLRSNQLLRGTEVLGRKKALDEAIEFESRNRRAKPSEKRVTKK